MVACDLLLCVLHALSKSPLPTWASCERTTLSIASQAASWGRGSVRFDRSVINIFAYCGRVLTRLCVYDDRGPILQKNEQLESELLSLTEVRTRTTWFLDSL